MPQNTLYYALGVAYLLIDVLDWLTAKWLRLWEAIWQVKLLSRFRSPKPHPTQLY